MNARTYITPGVYSTLTPRQVPADSRLLLDKLEDDYADYRHACNSGYCKSDPAIHEKFKSEISALKALINPPVLPEQQQQS